MGNHEINKNQATCDGPQSLIEVYPAGGFCLRAETGELRVYLTAEGEQRSMRERNWKKDNKRGIINEFQSRYKTR